MADKENTLQLRFDTIPEIDYRSGSEAITCPPGRVVVEMIPPTDMFGTLFLPDNLRDNGRPDVGVVISAGAGVPLTPGSLIVARGYDGTWREGFSSRHYKPSGQLRFYGVVCLSRGEPELVPWWDSIVATMSPTTRTITPTGANILIRRDPEVTQEGMILLHSDAAYRTNIATVVAVGPLCDSVGVGDRVLYVPNGSLDFDEINGDPDLALLTEDAIEAILTSDLEEAVA